MLEGMKDYLKIQRLDYNVGDAPDENEAGRASSAARLVIPGAPVVPGIDRQIKTI